MMQQRLATHYFYLQLQTFKDCHLRRAVRFGGLAPTLSATLATQHQGRTGLRTGFSCEQQKNGWCVIDCAPEAEPSGQRNPPRIKRRHIAKVHKHGAEASIMQNQIGYL